MERTQEPKSLDPVQRNDYQGTLAEWCATNQSWVEHELLTEGAILFRGFGVNTPQIMEESALAICRELVTDNGEHNRTSLTDRVYTPVKYPQSQKILWHNENSFNHRWPTRIFFACQLAAESGGETPIVDSREMHKLLDPGIRDRFAEKGVTYVRTYNGILGLNWDQVFQVDSRQQAEQYCRANEMTFEWDGDCLITRSTRPAVIQHPVTHEPCWFNQAQHWHPSCLDASTRQKLQRIYGADQMPRDCTFGDGTKISDDEMAQILGLYAELEHGFAWQPGDMMVLDNILTAHARNPYAGDRKLLVAVGDMAGFDQL